MTQEKTLILLKQIQEGITTPEEALKLLCKAPFQDLGFAKLDHHRELRQGVAEVIYGEGKTIEQLSTITSAMIDRGQKLILITRLIEEHAVILEKSHALTYKKIARIGIIGDFPKPNGLGKIVIATGGTCDMPIAEEAAITAEALGNEVVRLYDVGVAGLHRLLARLDDIMEARVIIAIAGMEGALASVIGGLANCPVIGVPTSVGYGASFNGLSALLTMLNSCASGVCVVNINNGFGAAYLANMINRN